MDLTQIEAVIFDMDGLVHDTEALYKKAWLDAASEMNFPLEEAFYNSLIGFRLQECEAKFAVYADSWLQQNQQSDFNVEQYIALKNQKVIDLFSDGVPFKKGFHTLWNRLMSQQLVTALVTSSHQASVERNFQGTDYLEKMHTVVTGDLVKNPKPDPEGYLLACEKLQISPDRALVFEDSNYGVEAANRAGCKVVMVPDMIAPLIESETRAAKIIDSLEDAVAWF